MSDDLRRIIAAAEALGFVQEDRPNASKRHLRFVHKETGAICIAASSPSDWRSRRNEIANMERAAGRRLPRQQSGRSHFKRVDPLDLRRTPTEVKDSHFVDDLLARASEIRRDFRRLALQGTRNGAEQARKLLADYEDIRAQLATRHRVIDPIY